MQQYYATEQDAKEYQYKIILFTISLYILFFLFVFSYVNHWILIIASSVLITRWMIAFHELFHLKKADELDWITRLVAIPFSPINIGYREYRQIHMGHHRHTAEIDDPDAFHIRGGHIKAFIGALTQHEQATYRFIKANGLSKELAVMMLIRAGIFIGLLLAFTKPFLIWFATLRITYIINDYVFFHLVHYRAGNTGTFKVPLPKWLEVIAIMIYGYDVVYATMHHDIHHDNVRIVARYLPNVADRFN